MGNSVEISGEERKRERDRERPGRQLEVGGVRLGTLERAMDTVGDGRAPEDGNDSCTATIQQHPSSTQIVQR